MGNQYQHETHKFDFGITDILPLLGISFDDTGRRKLLIDCPFCGKRKHFSIDTTENIFHCYRCGVSGGMLHLYSMLANMDRKQALEEIRDKLGSGEGIQPASIRRQVEKEAPNLYHAGPIEQRNAVYTALLKLLWLSATHRNSLYKRGLNDAEIERAQYRSIPIMGYDKIAYKLLAQGLELKGVPGFFRTHGYPNEGIRDLRWTLRYSRSGILIPIRDLQGRIQGMQIRYDEPIVAKDPKNPEEIKVRRYGWLSTNENERRSYLDGAKADIWIHIAGKPQKSMLFTEGALKMDVIHALSGRSGIAVPGVNNLYFLDEWLEQLYQLGTREIVNAYDMDLFNKTEVLEAYQKANTIIRQHGMSVRKIRWDPAYKGFDDFLCAQKTARKIS
jgi:DNA primase